MDIGSLSSRLKKAEDGIWYSTDDEAISYPQEGNEDCFALESTSWWFNHRNECIVSLVKAFPPPAGGNVFDIGGGNGFVSMGLQDAGMQVVLVEPGRIGARNAKARGIENVVCATTRTAGFGPGSLPAIGLFDVIEHIEDDVGFLREVRGMLRDDGRLYATVPTFQWLWSDEDVRAGHHRRYARSSITRVLERAGFDVEYSTYFFRILPLPILLLRALPFRLGVSRSADPRRTSSQDHESGKASGIVRSLLKPEITSIRRGKPMSFGGSCLLVARSTKG